MFFWNKLVAVVGCFAQGETEGDSNVYGETSSQILNESQVMVDKNTVRFVGSAGDSQ